MSSFTRRMQIRRWKKFQTPGNHTERRAFRNDALGKPIICNWPLSAKSFKEIAA